MKKIILGILTVIIAQSLFSKKLTKEELTNELINFIKEPNFDQFKELYDQNKDLLKTYHDKKTLFKITHELLEKRQEEIGYLNIQYIKLDSILKYIGCMALGALFSDQNAKTEKLIIITMIITAVGISHLITEHLPVEEMAKIIKCEKEDKNLNDLKKIKELIYK